jgi:hypothetical protein
MAFFYFAWMISLFEWECENSRYQDYSCDVVCFCVVFVND